MSKIAVIFPGQGSQYVGMGLDFYEEYSSAKQLYDQADEVLGDSLAKTIFQGPEESLRLTTNTQPAILVNSIAIWNVIKEETNIKPQYVAGHSLGEYSALVAAGSISYADAVQLVRFRGKFMEEAVPNGEGTMAAVMGMERSDLERICSEVTEQGNSVDLANINAPNQIVISGSKRGVELASNEAKDSGARRVIPLQVSGPFHSRLMQPAKEKLEPLVFETGLYEAKVPVVMNVTAQPVTSPEVMRENLINQVVSPVLWTDTIEWMINQGIDTFIEVGPGNVLAGLVKKIDKSAKTYSIQDIKSYEKFKEEQFVLEGGK